MQQVDVAEKRESEIKLVSEMIVLYCRGHHHAPSTPCAEFQHPAHTPLHTQGREVLLKRLPAARQVTAVTRP